ncbi:MAG: DEAD/DEAH box helicase [Anaerolineaceae bacterium]|nr:DEAD/DEAH box helicase [Anaerolineaceae bacterium]
MNHNKTLIEIRHAMYNKAMEEDFDVQHKIEKIEAELSDLDHHRGLLLDELLRLRGELFQKSSSAQLKLQLQTTPLNNQSPQEDKIRLFRSLFKGREDVFPRRFENYKTGKSGYAPVCRNEWLSGICHKPKIACQDCNFRAFVLVSDEIIRNHLVGKTQSDHPPKDFTIGVYPMLTDETCWFLAVDFDKSSWAEDAKAFQETCISYQVPASLERSRSGNGGHVWIFFESPVTALLARKLGALLLTSTMNRRPEIGMDSYDRLFPSQDTLPRGGFGNLIALPMQKKPREQNNSIFLDNDLNPYPDQWAYLSSIQKITEQEVEKIIKNFQGESEITGVRAVVLDENENEPWKLTPSRKIREFPITGILPEHINLIISNQIYIEKVGLPASLRNRIIRLAAFQNPEFYKSQAMRLSTFGKPRIISCCEEYPKHLALPRGCLEELNQLLKELKIKTTLQDERVNGTPIELTFRGVLRPEQQLAVDQLIKNDIGVLSASTAFGKTVIGAWLIAQRQVNTLVIVHRRQLMDQWVESLQSFLGLEKKEVGQIGGGKHKVTGLIDVAMVQSLVDKRIVNDLVENYGQVIVDECHHISAASFEQVIRQAKARFITGLSATVTRQDGHHPIIFMQCGPVRYRVDDRQQAALRSFTQRVIVCRTDFVLPAQLAGIPQPGIQEIYAMLVRDPIRNLTIVNDVIEAVRAGRSPVLLTERREHLTFFADTLAGKVKNIILLTGGMGRKQRNSLMEQLKNIPKDEERLIIATGRYLGEGFDDARLDTLFLALPIAWRGTVAQYAGRLHRNYDHKSEVIIYDYVDEKVPILSGMFAKRKKGYKAIGYLVSKDKIIEEIPTFSLSS